MAHTITEPAKELNGFPVHVLQVLYSAARSAKKQCRIDDRYYKFVFVLHNSKSFYRIFTCFCSNTDARVRVQRFNSRRFALWTRRGRIPKLRRSSCGEAAFL